MLVERSKKKENLPGCVCRIDVVDSNISLWLGGGPLNLLPNTCKNQCSCGSTVVTHVYLLILLILFEQTVYLVYTVRVFITTEAGNTERKLRNSGDQATRQASRVAIRHREIYS